MQLPPQLRDALDRAGAAIPPRDLAAATQRLVTRYRAGGPAEAPILSTAADVTAYAAYRMPATYAAVRAALAQLTRAAPHLQPSSHVDIGGGTGAAAWAARDTFPALTATMVLDRAAPALSLGRRLTAGTALATATWVQTTVDAPLPAADLVTVSYVLGELTGTEQSALVANAAAVAGGAVVVVEPGTPGGYERVLAARAGLLDAGFTVAAPCPHGGACPLPAGRDWCHFSVRVARSALHRRLKDAELSYEDEKFAYVAATRAPATPAAGRVLRHPQQRKGLVALRLCTPDGVGPALVSRRQQDAYRAARDARWGDAWPPA